MEENKIFKQLEEQISKEIENLESLEPGTEKHAAAVESLTKLLRLRLDEKKLEMEDAHYQNDAEDRLHQINSEIEVKNAEIALRDAELNERVKDRYFNLGFNIAAGLGKAFCFSKWLTTGLLFEENGTFVSPTFKLVWSKFNPFKK